MNQSASGEEPVLELRSATPADTIALGRRIAGLVRRGDILLLVGPLGAGKTLLAGGIAEGLGVREPVISPTFILARTYDGFLPVHHADVYRLGSTGEFDDLELPAMAEDGVLLIEWGNVVAGAVPEDHLVVELMVTDDEQRTVRFTPRGSWRRRSLEGLVA